MPGIVCLLAVLIYLSDTLLGRYATVLAVVWIFWFWLAVKAAKQFRRPVRRQRVHVSVRRGIW